MLTLEYVIENSLDSILQSYKYEKEVLNLILNLNEVDKKILIRIRTDVVSYASYYLEKKEELYRTCRIELHDLKSKLLIENGVFVPPNNFVQIMREKKLNYQLAYGEKASEVKFLFSLLGYDRLVTCLVADLDRIKVEEIR